MPWLVLAGALLVGCPTGRVMDGTSETGAATGSSTGGPAPTTGVTKGPASSTSTGVADSSGGIIQTPDMGDDGPCDLFVQNCPEGEKCMPYADDGGSTWNNTQCVPIDEDPAQPGEPCTVQDSGVSGFDDCDLGAMCWDVDPDTLMGTCIAMCGGTPKEPTCEDPMEFCSITSNGPLALCIRTCIPLQPDCPGGQACYPVNDYWTCAPDASGEMGAYGDPCEFINVCASGLVCIVPEAVPDCASAVGCCSEVCDVSDPAGDAQCSGQAQGQTCQSWYEMGSAPPGFENVGVCALPP